MEWWLTLLILLGPLIIFLLLRVPVFMCFMIMNVIGAAFLFGGGGRGFEQLVLTIFGSVANFGFIPVPLFLIMGETLFHSGVAIKSIDVVDKWLGRIPGRLGVVTVGGVAIFSALSGSSIGTVAMVGSLMIPEMIRRGYKKPIYLGAAMSGGVDAIIPPSAMAVIVAILAEMSVGKLLIAGFLPGLLMCVLYAIYIVFRCVIQPDVAPPYKPDYSPISEKILFTLKHMVPMMLIIFVVLGSIFFGICTPTESAGLGAIFCFLLAAVYKKFDWKLVKTSIGNALRITTMLLMILASAFFFSQVMAYTQASQGLCEWVISLGLSTLMILIAMLIIIMILGCFMDAIAILMIIFPVFLPIIQTSGIDLILFGLVTLIATEVGGRTPPFGIILFVMKSVAPPECTWLDIWKASAPFVLCDIVAMGIIIAFPIIATYLPSLMTH